MQQPINNITSNIDISFQNITSLITFDPLTLLYHNWDWENINGDESLIQCINLLNIQIENGYFINLSHNDYIEMAIFIININETNNSPLNKLKFNILKTIQNVIKKEDNVVKLLNNTICEKLNSDRIIIIDDTKYIVFSPILQRCRHYSLVFEKHNIVKLFEDYKNIIIRKYKLVCYYIENLLLKKMKIASETIKLDININRN